jgi:hypothetical protein
MTLRYAHLSLHVAVRLLDTATRGTNRHQTGTRIRRDAKRQRLSPESQERVTGVEPATFAWQASHDETSHHLTSSDARQDGGRATEPVNENETVGFGI